MSGCTLCYGGWAGRAGQQILCRVGSRVSGRGDQTVEKRASGKERKAAVQIQSNLCSELAKRAPLPRQAQQAQHHPRPGFASQ